MPLNSTGARPALPIRHQLGVAVNLFRVLCASVFELQQFGDIDAVDLGNFAHVFLLWLYERFDRRNNKTGDRIVDLRNGLTDHTEGLPG
ncbi:MAG: hypothetical protein ABIJ65_06910 [Chloroflexota bacterium]